MNSKRLNLVLIVVLVLLIPATFGVVYIGNNYLKNKSNKLVELKLENIVIDKQNEALVKAKKDIEEYSNLESIAESIVPKDKSQAKSVLEIVNIAEQNGIKISSIDFPNSNLGNPTPKSKPSSGEESTSQNKTSQQPPESQLEAVEGLKGVYKLPITIQPDEARPLSYNNLINFLSALEKNRRTAQVSSINITPKPTPENPDNVSFTLTINVFIKP